MDLLEASKTGNLERVEFLVEKGVNVNQYDKRKNTPLMLAAEGGYFEIADCLLSDEKIDIYMQNSSGNTALMLAVSSETSETGDIYMVVDLLCRFMGDNLDQQNKNGNTALMLAAKKGHDTSVDFIVRRGADLNLKNKKGNTALIMAARAGYDEIVDKLMSVSLDLKINHQNKDGETALMLAAKNGHEQVIESLLIYEGEEIVNFDIQNKDGETALMLASKNGHDKVVDFLIIYDSNVPAIDFNIQNKNGDTALMMAADTGKYQCALSLVMYMSTHYNVDFNVQNREGYTALMLAVEGGYEEIVTLLDDQGADRNIENNYHETALSIAKRRNYQSIVEILTRGRGISKKIRQLLELSDGKSNIQTVDWDQKEALSISEGCFEGGAGTLCDVNDQEDYKNEVYLKEDLDNLIFMIPTKEGGFKAYGTNVSAIVYDKDTDIFLNCHQVPRGTQGAYHYAPLGGDIKSFNLDLNELYVILRFDYQIYVSLEDLIGALYSGQRVFLLKPSDPEVKLSPTVAYSTAYGFKNNLPYNTVSGDHCQDGTDKVLSDIFVCYGDKC